MRRLGTTAHEMACARWWHGLPGGQQSECPRGNRLRRGEAASLERAEPAVSRIVGPGGTDRAIVSAYSAGIGRASDWRPGRRSFCGSHRMGHASVRSHRIGFEQNSSYGTARKQNGARILFAIALPLCTLAPTFRSIDSTYLELPWSPCPEAFIAISDPDDDRRRPLLSSPRQHIDCSVFHQQILAPNSGTGVPFSPFSQQITPCFATMFWNAWPCCLAFPMQANSSCLITLISTKSKLHGSCGTFLFFVPVSSRWPVC